MGWGLSITGFDAVFDLFDQLKFQMGGDGTVYIVAPTVEYAVFHEVGTSKMEARPFARPAAERVQAAPAKHAKAIAAGTGIDISTEDGLVRATALAVEREMKSIIKQKEIWDTGTMHASVTVQKVE